MGRLAEDAALLERALREDWPRERAELRELLARRPEWAALLEGPGEVAGATGAQAEADRRLVDELLALARARGPAPSRRGRLPTWGRLAAAALVLLTAGVGLWLARSSPTGESTQFLGGDGGVESRRVSCLPPAADGPAYGSFEWDADRPLDEGQSYELVVRDCTTGAELTRESLGSSSTLSGSSPTSWSPEAARTRDWPDCVEWSVTVLDANGFRVASDRAVRERSAH